ncbi:urease accessory protein UreD [Nocardia mangyaensis]|uniref:urease accessory protein UreD n=1 Tax=Nocardia mangyaensis TaxID=2213200 RepID=UPI002674A80F|nr:urease accessory protein UreD [Nocardia mangyaensis]MDO3648437.1 urease accessory protein UreD [Nocardia mangyaensis]
MRTELSIVAAPGRLPRIDAVGGLAGRHTGVDTVHLIGTAATPLGGDELDISIVVRPGARLVVRSVAATIALPSTATPLSVAHWRFEVGEGAELDFDPEPTIVAGGAHHHTVTTVLLAADARLRLRERVQLGRSGEDGGGWRGDVIADLGEIPLLRHRLELGAGTVTDDRLRAPRALDSELVYPDDRPAWSGSVDTVRLPLAAGGSLATSTGSRLRAEVPVTVG